MPLTNHLKVKSSPIRAFLRNQFPSTRTFLRDPRKQLREAYTIRPNTDVPWSTIGMALDYRIRYYFAVTPHEELAAYRGALLLGALRPTHTTGEIPSNDIIPMASEYRSFFSQLDALTRGDLPVARRLPAAEENELNRHCIVLALMEVVYRTGRLDGALAMGDFCDAESLIGLAESHWVDDLRELSWEFYDRFHHLLSLPHVLNPTLDGSGDVGGADADMIIDGVLIDIKTTVGTKIVADWIWQLLGYVLLDYSDHHHISGVGLYMARQGQLIQWDLDEVIRGLCAEEPLSIEELRTHFRELIKGL